MPKTTAFVLLILFSASLAIYGQVGGNLTFSDSGVKAKAAQRERDKRLISEKEIPPTSTTSFVDASVLMNMKADEYVAVFGIVQEGTTAEECQQRMERWSKQRPSS